MLLVQLSGAALLAHAGIDHAQVAKRGTFSPAVAGLARKCNMLLVHLYTAVVLAQGGISKT